MTARDLIGEVVRELQGRCSCGHHDAAAVIHANVRFVIDDNGTVTTPWGTFTVTDLVLGDGTVSVGLMSRREGS